MGILTRFSVFLAGFFLGAIAGSCILLAALCLPKQLSDEDLWLPAPPDHQLKEAIIPMDVPLPRLFASTRPSSAPFLAWVS